MKERAFSRAPVVLGQEDATPEELGQASAEKSIISERKKRIRWFFLVTLPNFFDPNPTRRQKRMAVELLYQISEGIHAMFEKLNSIDDSVVTSIRMEKL